MTIANLLLIIICVLGISAGQILFKLASTSIPTSLEFDEWITFAFNKHFFISVNYICYSNNTLDTRPEES